MLSPKCILESGFCVIAQCEVVKIHQCFRTCQSHHPDFRIMAGTNCFGEYTGCPRRNVPDFGRVFLMLNYTDITQNTYIQSRMVTEIIAREKCGLHQCRRTVRCP